MLIQILKSNKDRMSWVQIKKYIKLQKKDRKKEKKSQLITLGYMA